MPWLSLPSRERGLKFGTGTTSMSLELVAPFTGAWIEIGERTNAGFAMEWSLPSRERGLKYPAYQCHRWGHDVAPFTGAWIEIPAARSADSRASSLPSRERGLKLLHYHRENMEASRSLHGSVD